ncbi:MAG: hypothetical protein V3T54_03320, partial [Acidobacteriota bacterium]
LGGGAPPPAGVPDGNDDDIVARQLREAAEKEKDPELRTKLWLEYCKYKKSAGGKQCKKPPQDQPLPPRRAVMPIGGPLRMDLPPLPDRRRSRAFARFPLTTRNIDRDPIGRPRNRMNRKRRGSPAGGRPAPSAPCAAFRQIPASTHPAADPGRLAVPRGSGYPTRSGRRSLPPIRLPASLGDSPDSPPRRLRRRRPGHPDRFR